VDSSGIVYICDYGKAKVFKEKPSGNGYVQSVLPTATSLTDPAPPHQGPLGVGVDGYGRVLIADTGNDRVLRIDQAGADFGKVQIGSTSPVQTLMFNFSVSGTLNNLLILAQNVSAMDFVNAGTGNCAQGSFYFSNVRCTLDVKFSPKFAGDRNGAVLFRNTNLQTFVTSYLHGFGNAPQITYLPAYERSVSYLASGQAPPQGVAVDGNDVVYICDTNNNIVRREVPFHNSWTSSNVGTGLSSPRAIAVDAAGNVFVADDGNGRVVKITPAGNGSWQESVVTTGLSSPYGVAVGPDGAVYISDSFNSRVLKETPSGSGYVGTVIPISGLNHPYGIAVDGRGNLFVADVPNDDVLKLTYSNGKYTKSVLVSGISGAFGVAVDAMDNVYVALRDNATVLKYTPTGNSYVDHAVSMTGLSKPFGVAVDARGNVFVADVGLNQVMEGDFGDPPNLAFEDTQVNQTSGDSPKIVTIQNSGNLPLHIPSPSSGQNPSIPANFSVDSSIAGTCPVLNVGAYNTTLAAGASCEFYISFTPASVGSINASLIMTDDAQAATPTAQQSIPMSGNGVIIPTQVNWATPSAITYGTALSATQLNATATDNNSNAVPGSFVYTPPAGTILTPGSQMLSVAFTPTNAADYGKSSGGVTLQVQPAVLTVTAKAASRTYGAANPAFTYAITGFVNGDTAATALTGMPSVTTTATSASPVGSYTLTAAIGTLASSNYTFKFVNGTLTVNKANLNITANNASVAYNQAIPSFTYTASGFVNGDTSSVLSGAPTETTTAAVGSLPGTYPINITAGTLTAVNYSFTFKSGTLTITPLGIVATPVFAPIGGTYTGAQNVTITDATPGAVIHYTTNGTTPTASSTTYTVAIHVSATTTVKAIAIKPGYTNSAVATAAYTIN